MEKDSEVIRTSLRLPRDLYDKLAEASDGRTMHAEILARLEDSLSESAALSDATERAIGNIESLIDASKHDLDFMRHLNSQIRLMRYLLDQVAISNGKLPPELLTMIKVLGHDTQAQSGAFNSETLFALIEEVQKSGERIED